MTTTTDAAGRRVDELVLKGVKALNAGHVFEAERVLLKAQDAARAAAEFDKLADLLEPLWTARHARLEAAFDTGVVQVLNESVTEETEFEIGCYLLQPPQVGADARRLRLAGLMREIPVAVVCREPTTQLGLCPIVAICPGTTVRTKIDPPDDPDAPDLDWFSWAMEELGDWVIGTLDPELEITRRVDALINTLNAVPDHERLHLALADACRQAAATAAEPKASKARK